jgi:hypothetical protein
VKVALLQRLLGLAAVALLGGVIALAVTAQDNAASTLVASAAPAPGGGWYTALAATREAGRNADRTSCGTRLTPGSLGVSHPVLPCRTKLVLLFEGREVLTEVIDNRITAPGRQLELTRRLADQLGLDGTQRVRWRFAVRG